MTYARCHGRRRTSLASGEMKPYNSLMGPKANVKLLNTHIASYFRNLGAQSFILKYNMAKAECFSETGDLPIILTRFPKSLHWPYSAPSTIICAESRRRSADFQ